MGLFLLAAIASLGGLLFGYDTGVISGALLFIRADFQLSASMQDLLTSMVLVGAFLGAAMAGWVADRHGRRWAILAGAILFTAGSLSSALAANLQILMVGRVVVGLAIGIASMVVPLYLAEMAPSAKRGGIVSLNQLCVTLGILFSYLVDYAFADVAQGWRWMLGLGCVPGIILGIGMTLLPESARWLASQGNLSAAQAALHRAHGDDAVDVLELQADTEQHAPWSAILSATVRKPLIVGLGLAIFQQITGINTVIYYAPSLFRQAGLASNSASILATVGIGVVNVAMTILAVRLLDRWGRRVLLLAGLSAMAVTLLVLAIAFGLGDEQFAWIMPVVIAAYVGAFAIGLGPVFWLLISEIFPLQIRGRGMSLATMANWAANFAVAAVFLDLVHSIGPACVFFLFTLTTLACIAFTWFYVPETKGKTLEDIERHWVRKRQA